MDPFVQTNERYLSIHQWEKLNPDLVTGFTTRNGGQSTFPYHSLNMGFHVGDNEKDVWENRKRLAKDIKVPLSNWIGSEQVHEATIQRVTRTDAGKGSADLNTAVSETDGLYTFDTNLLLTSLYADCVPLYFFAPDAGAVGLAHAGWRGTVKGIATKMVHQWIKEGISQEEIKVAIGPSISKKMYEVDKKVIKEIQSCLPKNVDCLPYQELSNEKYLLDLREVNKILLIQEGIKPSNILVSNICTSLDEQMFSHRAENGKTGRMMSFIGLRSGGALE